MDSDQYVVNKELSLVQCVASLESLLSRNIQRAHFSQKKTRRIRKSHSEAHAGETVKAEAGAPEMRELRKMIADGPPCTLHLTPYTLDAKPYTLHPGRETLYPAP